MIIVSVDRGEGRSIRGFRLTGHAGYAAKGQDIVCAAVSAVAQTAVMGIAGVAGLQALVEIKDGDLSCVLPDVRSEAAQAILETMLLGLRDIASGYPDRVKLKET